MRYNDINEAKKAYKAAYSWAIKVQRACLLKEVDISVIAGYCEPNYNEGDIDAWTITVSIWDAIAGKHVLAEWAPYRFQQEFEDGKTEVLAYLKEKGITIK